MNIKTIQKHLFALGFGSLGVLGASSSFALSGEYTGSEYWTLGVSKSWGNEWAGGSYTYNNLAEAFHEGQNAPDSDQAVVTRTEMTLKARIAKSTIVLLQAFANGEARSLRTGAEFYRARGSFVLLGKEYLNANFYDYGSGTADLLYPQTLEKSVSKEATFYGVTIKGTLTGTLSGKIAANGTRLDTAPGVDGYDRAVSSLGIGAKVTGRLSAPLTSVSVELLNISVTPQAYSYRDADPERSATDRIRYRLGIDSPLSVSAGGGNWKVAGKTVYDWNSWSSSKSYGKHDHDERFASSWY